MPGGATAARCSPLDAPAGRWSEAAGDKQAFTLLSAVCKSSLAYF
ncbi:hypothetical protein HMPREF9371_1164 [Neisseria shayeganii 871]|uniref:Uncharacterized protein n=1 Tax=Neisseria shayeganii 871 TaxID=1032488 RepID=G4CHS5_9NEIS|nr:hypothetical protein HMPREF9371_1164 [Neisseria shayeganii 871]